MRLVHQASEASQVSGTQQCRCLLRTLDLPHHVPTPPVGRLGQCLTACLQHFARDISEGANRLARCRGQATNAILTGGSPLVVTRTGQPSLYPRIADHDATIVLGDGHQLIGEVPAIQEERMSGAPVRGDELVHYSAIHPHEPVFRPLSKKRRLRPRQRATIQIEQATGHRHFNGSRAA